MPANLSPASLGTHPPKIAHQSTCHSSRLNYPVPATSGRRQQSPKSRWLSDKKPDSLGKGVTKAPRAGWGARGGKLFLLHQIDLAQSTWWGAEASLDLKARVPALTRSGCVTLWEPFPFSGPQSPHLQGKWVALGQSYSPPTPSEGPLGLLLKKQTPGAPGWLSG